MTHSTSIISSLRAPSLGCGLILIWALMGTRAEADFFTSNLTSTQGFNSISGYNLTGPKAITGQGFSVAVRFTTGVSTSIALNSAQLALAYRSGTNALNVAVMTDQNGVPSSNALETLHLSNISAIPGLVTATSIQHPTLAAGVSYWLVATYSAADTNIAWFFNSLGLTGQSAYRPDGSAAQGSWTNAPTITDPGYAIAGTISPAISSVNAPTSGILVGMGCLGMIFGRLIQRGRSPVGRIAA